MSSPGGRERGGREELLLDLPGQPEFLPEPLRLDRAFASASCRSLFRCSNLRIHSACRRICSVCGRCPDTATFDRNTCGTIGLTR